jgi:hypothetical protein
VAAFAVAFAAYLAIAGLRRALIGPAAAAR